MELFHSQLWGGRWIHFAVKVTVWPKALQVVPQLGHAQGTGSDQSSTAPGTHGHLYGKSSGSERGEQCWGGSRCIQSGACTEWGPAMMREGAGRRKEGGGGGRASAGFATGGGAAATGSGGRGVRLSKNGVWGQELQPLRIRCMRMRHLQ